MVNFRTLDVPQQAAGPGFIIGPYCLHDATLFGPFPGFYWLVHTITGYSSNNSTFPYYAYLVEPGSLQQLKLEIASIDATSAGGLGYVPNFFGNVSAAASQPPLAGLHKIGSTSGIINDASWGIFQTTTQLSISNPQSGGTTPYNNPRKRIVVPSGYSLYFVAVGNAFGGNIQSFTICYQEFQNGCKPDTFGFRFPFRGAQWSDVPEIIL